MQLRPQRVRWWQIWGDGAFPTTPSGSPQPPLRNASQLASLFVGSGAIRHSPLDRGLCLVNARLTLGKAMDTKLGL